MGKDAKPIPDELKPVIDEFVRHVSNVYFPNGLPIGTKFSTLEDLACQIGDEAARLMMEMNVQEQAEDWPDDQLGECPFCGGAARKKPDEPRTLTTSRGDVAWKQRVLNCPRCRRAFFPSESNIGD